MLNSTMPSYFLNKQKIVKECWIQTYLGKINSLHRLSLMDINNRYLEINNQI